MFKARNLVSRDPSSHGARDLGSLGAISAIYLWSSLVYSPYIGAPPDNTHTYNITHNSSQTCLTG